MKKLIPLVLPVIGLSAGIGAGLFLKPAPQSAATEMQASATPPQDPHTSPTQPAEGHGAAESANLTYVKLNNQFIVPIIQENTVTSIVVLSLSLEIRSNDPEMVYAKEPKLRDGFLQVLFDHSNMGGFQGAFTNSGTMATLRRSLLSIARDAVGDIVTDVLITDLARQDV